MDPAGNVFVTDPGYHRIHKLGPNGQLLTFPTSTAASSPYYIDYGSKLGIAIDSSLNKLYVVVSRYQVAVFDTTTSAYLGTVGTINQLCGSDVLNCSMGDVAVRDGLVYIAGVYEITRFADSDAPGPPIVTPTPPAASDKIPPTVPLAPVAPIAPIVPVRPFVDIVPPADTTAPVPKLVGPPAVTAAANGVVGVTVACAEPVGQVCRSTVTITAKLTPAQITGQRAKPRVTTVTLGTKKVSVAGGKQLVVPIALSGKNRAILTRLKSIKATVALVVTDTAGNSRTLTRTITIKAPKPPKKPKPKS